MLQIIMFYSKRKLSFRLDFLGVGVTIVCIFQQLSAGAEPQRPLKHLGQKMLQIHYVLRQKSKQLPFRFSFFGVGVTIVIIVCVLQQLGADAEPQRPCRTPAWSPREAARNPTVKALFG